MDKEVVFHRKGRRGRKGELGKTKTFDPRRRKERAVSNNTKNSCLALRFVLVAPLRWSFLFRAPGSPARGPTAEGEVVSQLTQPLFLSSLTLASETDWATTFRAFRRSAVASDRP
jgi:hypothetical protein